MSGHLASVDYEVEGRALADMVKVWVILKLKARNVWTDERSDNAPFISHIHSIDHVTVEILALHRAMPANLTRTIDHFLRIKLDPIVLVNLDSFSDFV